MNNVDAAVNVNARIWGRKITFASTFAFTSFIVHPTFDRCICGLSDLRERDAAKRQGEGSNGDTFSHRA
jgi:hypothetical protein